MDKINFETWKKPLEGIVTEEYITPEVCRIRDVQNALLDLMAKKNHDYDNAFNKGCDELGINYALSRLYDKLNRLNAYIKGSFNPNNKGKFKYAVKDEGILDTIKDLANYCTMTIAWINEQTIIEDTNLIDKSEFVYFGYKVGNEISLYNETSHENVTVEITANYGCENLYGNKNGYVFNKNADDSYVSVTDVNGELVKFKINN